MNEENNNSNGIPSGVDNDNVVPVDPAVDVSKVSPSQAQALSLAEIEALTGRKYPSREAALKSIGDTFRFVGTRKEDIAKEAIKEAVDTSKFISKEQYEQDMFYSKNPDYSKPEIKEVLTSMAKAQGKSVSEVAQSDAFKSIFEKVNGYEQTQKLKTVLGSNPRIAGQADKLQQLRDAVKSGNTDEADSIAARTILEMLG